MVILSRVLKYRANRWANIIAGVFITAVQRRAIWYGQTPGLHYLFFGTIEVACTLVHRLVRLEVAQP